MIVEIKKLICYPNEGNKTTMTTTRGGIKMKKDLMKVMTHTAIISAFGLVTLCSQNTTVALAQAPTKGIYQEISEVSNYGSQKIKRDISYLNKSIAAMKSWIDNAKQVEFSRTNSTGDQELVKLVEQTTYTYRKYIEQAINKWDQQIQEKVQNAVQSLADYEQQIVQGCIDISNALKAGKKEEAMNVLQLLIKKKDEQTELSKQVIFLLNSFYLDSSSKRNSAYADLRTDGSSLTQAHLRIQGTKRNIMRKGSDSNKIEEINKHIKYIETAHAGYKNLQEIQNCFKANSSLFLLNKNEFNKLLLEIEKYTPQTDDSSDQIGVVNTLSEGQIKDEPSAQPISLDKIKEATSLISTERVKLQAKIEELTQLSTNMNTFVDNLRKRSFPATDANGDEELQKLANATVKNQKDYIDHTIKQWDTHTKVHVEELVRFWKESDTRLQEGISKLSQSSITNNSEETKQVLQSLIKLSNEVNQKTMGTIKQINLFYSDVQGYRFLNKDLYDMDLSSVIRRHLQQVESQLQKMRQNNASETQIKEVEKQLEQVKIGYEANKQLKEIRSYLIFSLSMTSVIKEQCNNILTPKQPQQKTE